MAWEECLLMNSSPNPQHFKGKLEAEIATVIHHKAKKLLHYNYHYFSPEFIRRPKNEFSKLVSASHLDHDFDKIINPNQFQNRIQKRIKRKKLDPNVLLTWYNNDSGYAYNIWEGWRGRRYDFTCWDVEFRLVVLSQTSSYSIERIFSRLKLVEDAIEENTKNGIVGSNTLRIPGSGNWTDEVQTLQWTRIRRI